MNIFVLSTGRSGTTTFVKACAHLTNYTTAHESRSGLLGKAHFQYPENHIEADNRLAWFLGRLDKAYGDNAMYVHLRRNDRETAQSFVKRYDFGIMKGYREAILMDYKPGDPLELALDMCDTVHTNIELFLKDKTRKMNFALENGAEDFRRFWGWIGGQGDLDRALAEWGTTYNASEAPAVRNGVKSRPLALKVASKVQRIVTRLPNFIKNA
jgi:hypothetical protein